MNRIKYILSDFVLLFLGIIIGICICFGIHNNGKVVFNTDIRKADYVKIKLNGAVDEKLTQVKVSDGENLVIRHSIEKGLVEINIENNKTKIQKTLRKGTGEDTYVQKIPAGSYKVHLICKSDNILERIFRVGVIGYIELEAVKDV